MVFRQAPLAPPTHVHHHQPWNLSSALKTWNIPISQPFPILVMTLILNSETIIYLKTTTVRPGNLEPETWNLEPGTWNLEPRTWNLEPGTQPSHPCTYTNLELPPPASGGCGPTSRPRSTKAKSPLRTQCCRYIVAAYRLLAPACCLVPACMLLFGAVLSSSLPPHLFVHQALSTWLHARPPRPQTCIPGVQGSVPPPPPPVLPPALKLLLAHPQLMKLLGHVR